MRHMLLLLRIQLKQRLSSMAGRAVKKRSAFKSVMFGLLIALVILSIMSSYIIMLIVMHSGIRAVLTPESALSAAGMLLRAVFMFSMLATLFFGTVSILGIMFRSNDSEFLASLPVKPWAVFGSKFVMVYIYELAISAMIILPAIIIHAVFYSQGTAFYILGAALILLVPLIPLTFSSLLALPLMRLAGASKRRDLFAVIGGLLLVGGIVVGQSFFSRLMTQISTDQVFLTNSLLGNQSIIAKTAGFLPPAEWCANALTLAFPANFIYFLITLGTAATGLALALMVAGRIYHRGSLAMLEARADKKRAFRKADAVSGSAVRAFFTRDLRVLLRTPVYAMNCLSGIIIFPLMFVVMPMLINSGETEAMSLLSELVRAPESKSGVFAALFGIFMFCAMINPAGTTSVSREGKHIWMCRIAPVPYSTQIYGKLAIGYSVSAITILVSAASLLVFFSNMLSPADVFLSAAVAIVAALPVTALGMVADVYRPKLAWSNETEAVKQNMNAMLGMLIGIVVSAVIFVAGVASYLLSQSLPTAAAVTAVLSATLGAFSVLGLGRLANYMFPRY